MILRQNIVILHPKMCLPQDWSLCKLRRLWRPGVTQCSNISCDMLEYMHIPGVHISARMQIQARKCRNSESRFDLV